MKKLVIMSLVVLVAVFLAAPSAMAKKQLTEDELEMITAAGQPMIIEGGTGSINYTDTSAFDILLPTGAQENLMTLVLNNVVGENQLANAFNIQSSTATTSGTQENTITQSWGATRDVSAAFATVAGVAATAAAHADGGDAIVANVCIDAKCGIQYGKAGNAGNGAAAAAAAAVRGVIMGAVLSQYADVIITGDRGVSGDIFADVNPVFTMTLDETSQAGLLALVVNNVVGMNQVANAFNIASGSFTYNPAGGGFILGATQGVTTGQTNTINQFRGTPFSRPAAPIVVGP